MRIWTSPPGPISILLGASTVDEVIALIPSEYRDVLRAPLKGIQVTVEKLVAARTTLAKWEKHKASGTYPAFIASKPPSLVLSSVYNASEAGAAHHRSVEEAHKAYLDLLLTNAIKAKSDDVLFLNASVELSRLQRELLPLVTQVADSLKASAKLPVYREKMNANTGVVDLELVEWEDNPTVSALAKEMRSDVALYSHRVFHLTEQRSLTVVKKQFEKKRVKEDADVEMKDATTPGPSIQSLVDKAVSSQL